MEYDFRARFRLPVSVVGRSVSWAEGARLVSLLSRDPSSWTAASLAGWEYPLSREALILSDLLDIQHASKARKRPAPYPRPWDHLKQALTKRRGNAAGRTPEQVKAILRQQFGQPERPSAAGLPAPHEGSPERVGASEQSDHDQ